MRIFAFIFALLLVSCETDKENAVSQTEITNFVSEILSDTTNLKIIESKKTLISNFDFTPELPIEFEGYQTTRTQYISEILEEKDLPNYIYIPTLNLVEYVKSFKNNFSISVPK